MARPGGSTSHCSPVVIWLLAAPSITPHSGTRASGPRPRKLRPAAVRIALPTPRVASTMMGARQAGSTWRQRMRRVGQPSAVAAVTKSSARTCITLARTWRATVGTLTTDTATITGQHAVEGAARRLPIEERGDGDGQDDAREGEQHVGQAHQEAVHAPAAPARREPGRHPHREREHDREQARQQREPRAVEQAAEDVVARGVGAEPVRGARRRAQLVLEPGVALLGLPGRQVGQQRHQRHEQHEHEAHARAAVGEQAPEEGTTRAHRGLATRRRGSMAW